MEKTPAPVSLAQALALPRTPGRSSEILIDGDMEIRFAAKPRSGPQEPHLRDEFYVIARGHGRYRYEGKLSEVGAGDMCFAAAHAPHGFEDITEDFCVWVMFYGAVKEKR
jgi:mannose-6-phosphate isomerase-like protein (cupin superfamily)